MPRRTRPVAPARLRGPAIAAGLALGAVASMASLAPRVPEAKGTHQAAVIEYNVAVQRRVFPFAPFRSLAVNGNGESVVVLDRAYALSGPAGPGIKGIVEGVSGAAYISGDLLLESDSDKVVVHRRLAGLGIVPVGEFALRTRQCGDPMSPSFLGWSGGGAVYVFRGTDCPNSFPAVQTSLAHVDLTDPTSPTLGAAEIGPRGERTRSTATAMNDGIVAHATVGTSLGGVLQASAVTLWDASSLQPRLLGTWQPGEPFEATYVMIARGHLYVDGNRYGQPVDDVIVDIADPANPRTVWTGTGMPWFSRAAGMYGYGSSGTGLALIDLSDPVNPIVMDTVVLVGRPVWIEVDGDWVHAVAATAGHHWYQPVRHAGDAWLDSEAPVQLPEATGWSGLPDVAGGTVAFPAASDGLHLFDASPLGPRFTRTVDLEADVVALEPQLAVVGRADEVVVSDLVGSEARRATVRTLPLDTVIAVEAESGLMAALGGTELATLDLEAAEGAEAGRTPISLGRAIALAGPLVAVLESPGEGRLRVRVVDAFEPSLPRVASVVEVPATTHGIATFEDRLYVVGSHVSELDLSHPTRPRWTRSLVSPGEILPRRIASEHGYLFLTLAGGGARPLSDSPLAVLDMSLEPPHVVQRLPYPADAVADPGSLVRVGEWVPPQIYALEPRPIAVARSGERCGTTSAESAIVRGTTSPESVTVTLSAGLQIVDTTVSSTGAFSLTALLAPGRTDLSVQGASSRGPGPASFVAMTSRPELALDPWRTFLQSGGYRSRPVDGSGCVSFDDAWSIALPATPFEIETGAAPGSSVSMSLADATVELHESSPGLFTGQFDELDVPRSGALIRFEVSEAGTAQTFEGAALTYRAYVPRLANGWRPADR